MRFPAPIITADVVHRLLQTLMRRLDDSALFRDLADDLDDLLQQQFRAGYEQGYSEGAHEIRHDDE
jgi:hypothetical protein